jgi:hypothetical protein
VFGVRVAGAVTAPLELTVIFGVPVDCVKVTVPCVPLAAIDPLNAVPAGVEPDVPVTVIVPPVTVRVKVHVPLSPDVSCTVPVAV